MTISMYAASVPVFQASLTALSAILDKAAAHCAAKKIDPAVMLQTRLFPDMLPFVRQVQIAADFAKGTAARLAGVEVPKYEDNEASFDDLKARIAKTLAFVTGLDRAAIEASADRDVMITVGGQPMHFKGLPYLLHFATPNLYFHVTTAYALLRHNGVEIGKRDFMGRP